MLLRQIILLQMVHIAALGSETTFLTHDKLLSKIQAELNMHFATTILENQSLKSHN